MYLHWFPVHLISTDNAKCDIHPLQLDLVVMNTREEVKCCNRLMQSISFVFPNLLSAATGYLRCLGYGLRHPEVSQREGVNSEEST